MATQNERAVIDLVINGQQSEASMKSLTAATINARKALYSMAETDPGYKKQKTELESLMRVQQGRIVRINEEKSAWQKFMASSGSMMAGVVGGNLLTTGIQKLIGIIPDAINKYRAFNSASADMSANLGLAAKDVAYFNEQAKAMGPALGKSAAEILDGFKLVGSANSDLIKTPELLADVTKQAIILSQASNMTLADATASLVGSMNQFDAGADQSTRFINAMAGGAQVGSAEIGDMATALKASGIVAHQAGLSYETTNGALQSLSKESLRGEQAGTMFRNILLELQKGAADTNPRIVGLDKALENLAGKNLSATEMTKMFGKENVTAALSLVNHRDRVAEFTKGLTGTSAAYDMAAKNNATLDHQLELFNALVEQAALWLGTKLAPAFSRVVQEATSLITALPQLGGWLIKNSEWLLMTAIPSLVLYNGTLIKATASAIANTVAEGYRRVVYEAGYRWMLIQTTATSAYALITGVLTGQISIQTAVVTVARGVWAAFSAVLAANPIGAVVVALTALAGAAKYFSEHTERALDLERKKQALQKQGVKDTQLSSKALQEVNERAAHANELSQTEQENLKKTIALKQLETRARLSAALARAREIARQEADPTFWQGMKQGASNVLTGNWNANLDAQKKQQTEANKAAAYAEAKQLANVDQLQTDLAQYDKLMNQTTQKKLAVGGGGGAGSGLSDAQKKAAKKDKAETLRDAEKLEKLLADARMDALKDEQSDYEKSVFAFAEKYSEMYELAGTNTRKIREIETLSLIAMTTLQKKYSAKQAEEQRKADLEELKGVQELAEKELKLRQQTAKTEIVNRVAAGGISKEEGKVLELEAEQQFLLAKELLYSQHYETMMNAAWGNDEAMKQVAQDMAASLTAIDQAQLQQEAETATAKAELRKADLERERELKDRKKQFAADEVGFRRQLADQLLTVLSNDWTSTLAGYKTFWKESSVLQKAALIAQKAYALAEIGINLAKQISMVTTTSAAMNAIFPGSGIAFEIKGIAKAIGLAAAQSASVVGIKAFADGGFTGSDQQPTGYTSGPTYYKKGNYIAGEAGKEWIMSAPMLKNPVMANLAGALQSLQVSGQWRNLTPGNEMGAAGSNAGGSSMPGITPEMFMSLIREVQMSREATQGQASRPISFDILAYERKQAELQQIRNDTKL